MKKLVLIFSLFSCLYFSFAQTSFSSVYSKPRRLYVRQTQYFDFIYPKDSRLTVDLLIDKVDASYEKLADYLNVEKKLRFPVVVSPDTDILNAYFMPMPYNRIVLFDTVSSDKDDVYASTLLDVFEHELTHALSLNIKTSAWKVASYVVGDMASPVAVWSLPALFVEGISVFTESMDGKHGRLNDDLTMQMLIQAKMEKRFPTWQEVSGAKDTYPTGNTSYIFGGAFCAFIQQKYGLDKFREFWHECGRPQFFRVTAGIYKKVYGVSLAADWREFADSIQVPHSEEIENHYVLRKGLITTLDGRGDSFVWNDTRSKKVYLSKWDGKKIRTDDLFNSDNMVNRLSLSSDGRYLAVFGAVSGRGNYEFKRRMYIYDVEKRRFLFKTFPGVFDGAIFHENGDDIHLLQVFTKNQKFTLRRTVYNVKTKDETILWERPFGEDERIFTPMFISKDEIAFILREVQGDSIVLQKGSNSGCIKINPNYDDELRIRYLMAAKDSSSHKKSLHFSWNSQGQTGDGQVFFEDDRKITVYLQADAPILGVERCFPLTDEIMVYISRGFYSDEIRISSKKNFFYDLATGVFEPHPLNLVTDFSVPVERKKPEKNMAISAKSGGNNSATGTESNTSVAKTEGNNSATGTESNNSATGSGGNTSATGSGGNTSATKSSGNTSATGTESNNSVTGTESNNSVTGTEDNNSVTGSGGNTSATGSGGNNFATGSGGNTSATKSGGNNSVTGSGGNTSATGSGGNNSVTGSGGNTSATGSGDNNSVTGSGGNNSVAKTAGNNSATGSGGNNSATGTASNNSATGTEGNNSATGTEGNNSVAKTEGNNSAEKWYNPFKYSMRGFFLPLLAIPALSATQSTVSDLKLGLTYMTSTPTEASQFLANVGYAFSEQPGTSQDAISTGISYVSTHTPVTLSLSVEMDNHFNGQNLLSGYFRAEYVHYFRNYYEALVVNNLLMAQTNFFNSAIGDSLQIYFTNYRQVRVGVFDILGIQAGLTGQCALPLNNFTISDLDFRLGGFFNFGLPGILIFENPRNFTLNLPLKTDLRIFFNEHLVTFMSISPKVVVFSAEIQRAFPFFPLYFKRITLDAQYYLQMAFPNLFTDQGVFKDFAYIHLMRASLYTTVTPIIGVLTNTSFDIGVQMEYNITDNKLSFSLLGGFSL